MAMTKRRWQDLAVGLVVPVLAIAVWQLGGEHGLGQRRTSCRRRWQVWHKWVAYLLPLQDFADLAREQRRRRQAGAGPSPAS